MRCWAGESPTTPPTFALVTLAGYVPDVKRQVMQAQHVAADIEEQLEDAGERFESPHVETLQRVARDMTEYLDAAQAQAQRIDSITTQAIAEAGEEMQA
jgi:hypothetical protein